MEEETTPSCNEQMEKINDRKRKATLKDCSNNCFHKNHQSMLKLMGKI